MAGAGYTRFETAAGKLGEASLYHAVVRVLGRESLVHVNLGEDDQLEPLGCENSKPTEDVDKAFGFSTNTDDALLGCEALAALGLVVDCSQRRLVPTEAVLPTGISTAGRLSVGSLYLPVEFSNPWRPASGL